MGFYIYIAYIIYIGIYIIWVDCRLQIKGFIGIQNVFFAAD